MSPVSFMAVSLVETDCGLALLRLLSRGHAVVAERLRYAQRLVGLKRCCPTAIATASHVHTRLASLSFIRLGSRVPLLPQTINFIMCS